MDDYFYEIFAITAAMMVGSIGAFSMSITEEQMNNKDKDGKITFNKFQNAMVIVFRWALYGMLFTAGWTIAKGIESWSTT